MEISLLLTTNSWHSCTCQQKQHNENLLAKIHSQQKKNNHAISSEIKRFFLHLVLAMILKVKGTAWFQIKLNTTKVGQKRHFNSKNAEENYLLQCNEIRLFDVTHSTVYIVIFLTPFVSHWNIRKCHKARKQPKLWQFKNTIYLIIFKLPMQGH